MTTIEPYQWHRDCDGHELMVLSADVTIVFPDIPGTVVHCDTLVYAESLAVLYHEHRVKCRVVHEPVAFVDLTEAYQNSVCPNCELDIVWTPPQHDGLDLRYRTTPLCRACDDEAFAAWYGLSVKSVRESRDRRIGRDGWGLTPPPETDYVP